MQVQAVGLGAIGLGVMGLGVMGWGPRHVENGVPNFETCP